MRLKRRQKCPIHNSYFCCGRQGKEFKAESPRKIKVGPGVYEIPDKHHPRGFRIYRTPSAMRELVLRKMREQGNRCCICDQPFDDMRDVTAEHVIPRGMGAAWRDDHEKNIGAAHGICNTEKGSKRA